MKNLITFLFILFVSSVFSQKSAVNTIFRNASWSKNHQYQVDTNYQSVSIESKFGDDTLLNINLKDKRIVKIDYVSTEYQSNEDFNQLKLDYYRVKHLLKSNPYLTKKDFLTWNFIRQTGCSSAYSCKDFFHGFVIYYTKEPTKVEMMREVQYLEDYMESIVKFMKDKESMKVVVKKKLKCRFPHPYSSNIDFYKKWRKVRKNKIKVDSSVEFYAKLTKYGRIDSLSFSEDLGAQNDYFKAYFKKRMKWSPAKVTGGLLPSSLSGSIKFPIKEGSIQFDSYSIIADSTLMDSLYQDSTLCECYNFTDTYPGLLELTDQKVVSKVLERNKDNWKKNALVVDVTGSMYPYTADLLLWIKLSNLEEIKSTVFFNDGDERILKPIGKTGGIYSTQKIDYDSIKYTMYKTMLKGGGGDCPENNFEALKYAKKKCSDCKNFIMLADNYAFPRDWKLLKDFSGNLRIVLCGASGGIDPKYLTLAKRYGFTVHTMENDLLELSRMREGDIIEIEGFQYKISKGRFIKVTKS